MPWPSRTEQAVFDGNAAPFRVVIPARYGSSRLPGKPLLKIAGTPMILHVCRQARDAGAEELVVATDDRRIEEEVSASGVDVVMTRPEHQSGTERIAEVAQQRGWADEEIVVNLQGDEPLMPPALIGAVAQTLARRRQADAATLAAPLQECREVFDPNVVKVVLNQAGFALYFSRAPIPWDRDRFATARAGPAGGGWLRHIGIYSYRVGFLKRYVDWPASSLEGVEKLEQLRILWHGGSICVETVDVIPEAGVDTAEDLERVERRMAGRQWGAQESFERDCSEHD